jgi:hypothetical protein
VSSDKPFPEKRTVWCGNEHVARAGREKEECFYEAYPMVNCDEPVVVSGTSLTYIVYIPVGIVLSIV